MGENPAREPEEQASGHPEEPAARPPGGVHFGDIGGNLNIEGDVVGGDKITQNFVTNITNNITQVTRVIRNPALWQDAVWGFLTTHRWYLLVTLLLVLALLAVFWIFKDLYLIPWLAFVGAALLLAVAAWQLYRRPWTRLRQGAAAASGVGFLAIVGFYTGQILFPPSFPADRFGIAIAELGEGDGFRRTSAAREISDAIYQSLCTAIDDEFPRDRYADACTVDGVEAGKAPNPIAVLRLGVVPDEVVARRLGSQIGADVIVWGRVRTTQDGVSVDYEILETLDQAVNPIYPLVLPVTSRTTEITFETGQLLETSRVESAVSGMARNIALYTLGLQAYLDRRFPDTLRLLAEVARRAEAGGGLPISDEGRGWIYFYLGRSAHNLQMIDQGQDWLLQAREINPAEPAIPHSLALGYGMLAGEEALRDQYFAEALQKLEQWLTFSPDDPVAYYNRAEIYWVYQKPRNQRFAELDFEEALELDPSFIAASVSYGRFLTDQQQFERAEAVLRRALEQAGQVEANPAWIYLGLADILRQTGRLEEAREAYEAATAALPEEPVTHYLYAGFAEQVGDVDVALAEYNAVIEHSFNKGWAYEQLANFWTRREEHDLAALNFEKAVREQPQNGLLRAYLGDAYARAGREADAFAAYEDALALDPGLYYVYDAYAVRLERTGEPANRERAAELYRGALAVRPLDDFALEGLVRIFSGDGRLEAAAAAGECLTAVQEVNEAGAAAAAPAQAEAENCVETLLADLADQ